jgi:hypothetical protein
MAKISTLPLTDVGSAAAAVVDRLPRPWPVPEGVEVFQPASREEWLANRVASIGASEAPCLLGVHPHMSAYELFARKTGALEAEQSAPDVREDSIHLPPMERGNFLEEKALELARRLRPEWEIISNPMPGGSVYRDLAARMSSTPDARIFLPDGSRATLQIKNVEPSVFGKKWKEDGQVTPPLWVAIQASQDAALTGADRAFVGAMVVGFNVDFWLIEVPIHGGVLTKLRKAVADFWGRIERNDPPPPDYAKDGAVIAALYNDPADVEIDLSGNRRMQEIMVARDELKRREADGADAAKARKVYDAEILHLLGNCSTARIPGGRVLEAKLVSRKGYEVKPSSYRMIKVKD